jgi:hypothetical protein
VKPTRLAFGRSYRQPSTDCRWIICASSTTRARFRTLRGWKKWA